MKTIALGLLFVRGGDAFPSLLGCDREVEVGATIMSAEAVMDSSRSLVIERDGEVLTCGESTYVPGETLLARIDDVSSVRYIMEISGGSFESECDGSSCDGLRCAKGNNAFPDGSGEMFTAPTDGSDLVLSGGFATGFSAVSIMEECVLTSEDAGAELTAVPPFTIITNGTCAKFGMEDFLTENLCRAVLDAGYYNTRDQNSNGVTDSEEEYPIVTVDGQPPGCWPVEPGAPGFDGVEFPFACITPLETAVGECSEFLPCFCKLPEYTVVTEGTCVSAGMVDILNEPLCRATLNDGYYNSRDQNSNGIIDSEEDYAIPFVDGLPPGCWPVEPGAPGFEGAELPFACITPLETAVGNCSEFLPCFCNVPEYTIVTEGTCVSHGLTDILDEDLCRAVMNDGFYSLEDQNSNGIIDSAEDYTIVTVDGQPPGCWPVLPGAPGFDGVEFPFACITPLETAVGECSEFLPCFCLTGDAVTDTIVDIAVATEMLSTLVTALTAADLVETLNGDGPFTVFAPTNDAFDGLPDGTLESLLNDTAALTDVLLFHVVSGMVSSTDLSDGQIVSTLLNGATFMIDLSMGVSIKFGTGMASVTQADIMASNGIIHVIDTVLIPTTAVESQTAVTPFTIITSGTCAEFGMEDFLTESQCRAVLNAGYYNTRDQNSNGVTDSEEEYPIVTVDGQPPGCWPVEPGAPGFDGVEFPFACITPLETAVGECSEFLPCFCKLPEYTVVTEGTCVSAGMVDILNEPLCRATLNDGYYNTRDQNSNGIIDSEEDYAIPFVDGLPPGCWPVEPNAPGFEGAELPFACITPLETAAGDCSEFLPCFCNVPEYTIVTEGTCVSNGFTDILDEDLCRAVMNDGFYSSEDQNSNGVIDSAEDYTIVTVDGQPPGCWPVLPGAPGFEDAELPFACITPLETAVGECTEFLPCFCLTEAPMTCTDSETWYKRGDPSRDCAWVSTHAPRCGARGFDGTMASYSCPAACGTECLDSTSWHKNNDPSKDCAWVSTFPQKRCFVFGEDRILASEACPTACA